MTATARQEPFAATRAEGRTGPGGVPLLCVEINGCLPMVIALEPAQVLVLGSWLASQRPLAARRVAEREDRCNAPRHRDGDEPSGHSSLTGR
jgi:hypothetical protein